jgi:hypothetical protein
MRFDAQIQYVFKVLNYQIPKQMDQFLLSKRQILTKEVSEIREEAHKLLRGWGDIIFAQALEVLHNDPRVQAQMKAQNANAAPNVTTAKSVTPEKAAASTISPNKSILKSPDSGKKSKK